MNKHRYKEFQRFETIDGKPVDPEYDFEEEADMEQYIEVRRKEFYEEWLAYLMRDEED